MLECGLLVGGGDIGRGSEGDISVEVSAIAFSLDCQVLLFSNQRCDLKCRVGCETDDRLV